MFTRAKQAKEKSKHEDAAEKIKIAVNSSYDETANLNKEYLKENLNKIEGINPKIEEVTYDLNITVDGYKFIISESGQVKSIGEEKENEDLELKK